MSRNLRQCLKNMEIICKTSNCKLKKSLLKKMSCEDCYYKAIYEIAWNIYQGKITLTALDKKKLRKNIKVMEKILAKPKSKLKRASAVKQSGGFLNIAIPLVISVLGEIFRNAAS